MHDSEKGGSGISLRHVLSPTTGARRGNSVLHPTSSPPTQIRGQGPAVDPPTLAGPAACLRPDGPHLTPRFSPDQGGNYPQKHRSEFLMDLHYRNLFLLENASGLLEIRTVAISALFVKNCVGPCVCAETIGIKAQDWDGGMLVTRWTLDICSCHRGRLRGVWEQMLER